MLYNYVKFLSQICILDVILLRIVILKLQIVEVKEHGGSYGLETMRHSPFHVELKFYTLAELPTISANTVNDYIGVVGRGWWGAPVVVG